MADDMPNENFSIPVPVREKMREVWRRIGIKNKWKACTAAVLAFYRMTEEEQNTAIEAVEAARRRNDFRHLLVRDIGETGDGGPMPRAQVPEQDASLGSPAGRKRGQSKRPARTGGRSR